MSDAEGCPNCRPATADGCSHLQDGDPCPNCTGTLVKPSGLKVRCPRCYYIVNGENNDYELADFDITHRQAKRLLDVFGYDTQGTPGDIGTRLRRFCSEEGIDRFDLNGLLADLRELEGVSR